MKRDTNIKYLSLPILILFIYFGNPEKCEHMTIFLIPDNHTGKLSSKRFRLQFSTHHIKLVKINENQSIIKKKFNLIFRKKCHHGLLWSRWDPSRNQGLSEWYHRSNIKTHRDEVQKITKEYMLFNISAVVS